MVKKLKSNSGETLVEVLIASLVIALGMILFVNMTTSSFKIVTKAQNSFKEYNDKKNELEETNFADMPNSGEVILSYDVNSSIYINVNPAQKYRIPISYKRMEDENGYTLVRYKGGADE